MMDNDTTIFAPATPTGGALAVIRISGGGALELAQKVFSGRLEHSRISHGRLMDGKTQIDDIMATYYKSPNSYTGEDMAELFTHGGAAVVEGALKALSRAGGVPAQPGEFTKRAFLNGKMDLSQAEAVMDMISAGASMSAHCALEQLNGSLSREIGELTEMLTDALSAVNAAIDYPEELDDEVYADLPHTLDAVLSRLDALLRGGMQGRVIREGAKLVILGRPNAGKSSLLNALLGSERAIVAPVAGTTRDIIDEPLRLNGIPARLIDTAGIREGADYVEDIGIRRAKLEVEQADLLLLTFDGSQPFCDEDERICALAKDKPRLALLCKSDLPQTLRAEELARMADAEVLEISALTGDGIDTLKNELAARILPNGEPLVTNARHIHALNAAREAIESARAAVEPDCIATDMRAALIRLGEITGRDADSEMIDRIFANFCVGK